MRLRQPIDDFSRIGCNLINKSLIVLALGLGLNVAGKQFGTVVDTGGPLDRCSRSRYEPR